MVYKTDKYEDYFDIDDGYLSQINQDSLNKDPDIWKKFYPHKTFVKLIKDTINVISRKQLLSIWVEGAYGTGKSHAVLTLKKLLDASEEETREYFDEYKEQLDNDMFNQFQQLKNSEQKILTVSHYGSSNIYSDNNLVSIIEESISKALVQAGIKNNAQITLKDSIIRWLSEPWAKNTFNYLISDEYVDLFGGDDVENIIEKLNTYSGNSLQELISKIMKVGDEKQFKALSLDVDGLVEWIKAIIKANNLKAIVFIWDEFTEYFKNNMRALTGFQKIADLSGTNPFYLIIVTHDINHIFSETNIEGKKILGRFVNPTCNIELPENMAFQLMGNAMKKKKGSQKDWNDISNDLYGRTHVSRELVKKKSNIDDNELKAILPIHPYTALLLKHISSVFDSNQRSMFDFIKNDKGDEIKNFQWFIKNCSPFDENPLLTIDMLWDFFYERGKENLSRSIRYILDCYYLSDVESLTRDEQRILKAILLLQAISYKTGDSVELFIPNQKNIDNAFEGSDLENREASRIAEKLVRDNILFKKSMRGGKFQYSALINVGNSSEIDRYKKEQLEKSTSALINEGEFAAAFSENVFKGAFRLRYEVECVSVTNLKTSANRFRERDIGNKIAVIITFAKNDEESAIIENSIKEIIKDNSYDIVFIDASITPLGSDFLEQYAEAMANSIVNFKQDRELANHYESNAKEVLKKWKNKIMNGEFIVYTKDKPMGERVITFTSLYTELSAIDRKYYPNALEIGASVSDTMWQSKSIPLGVECGAKESTSGMYDAKSSTHNSLEKYIGEDVWQKPNYWIDKPYLPISKIKQHVEDVIAKAFENEGRVSIAQIYESLKQKPYGFMPCSITAFVMGFVLKEYTKSSYSWSDGITTDVMSINKLKEMVNEIIKNEEKSISRYKDKYIVIMTDEEKAFNEVSSKIFRIDLKLCSSIEQTREYIRQKMKELSFPIWCLKFIIDDFNLKSTKQEISELIDKYVGIANNVNFGVSKSDTDIALEIGALCIKSPDVSDDMALIISKENCTKGMDIYLHKYEDGKLIELANEVNDNGQYINRLRKKFDADAANWVWNTDTANQRIDEVILEYKIIVQTNIIFEDNIESFDETVDKWCYNCKLIRISYLYAKNSWGKLSNLMALLYNIKKLEQLPDSQKQKFLEEISLNGVAFKSFCDNQIEILKKACSFIIGQLSDDEIGEVIGKLPQDVFTTEKAIYQKLLQARVEEFINKQSLTKLQQSISKLEKLWNEKTGTTETPRQWSKKYKTPILAIVPDNDIQTAKLAFDIINDKKTNENDLEKALEYFEHADFFDKLNNKEEIDKAFTETIIKSYCVVLNDVDEVRDCICKRINSEAYDWFRNPKVDKIIYEMAEYNYNENGYKKALDKINNMDSSSAKHYLEELVRDNMIVGIEILRDN